MNLNLAPLFDQGTDWILSQQQQQKQNKKPLNVILFEQNDPELQLYEQRRLNNNRSRSYNQGQDLLTERLIAEQAEQVATDLISEIFSDFLS